MYFTVIKFSDSEQEFKIIHVEPVKKIAEDFGKYVDYVAVNCKPTFDEAKIILEICKTGTLTSSLKNSTTVKL